MKISHASPPFAHVATKRGATDAGPEIQGFLNFLSD